MTLLLAIAAGVVVGRVLRSPAAPLRAPRWFPLVFVAAAIHLGTSLLPESIRSDASWPSAIVTNAVIGTWFIVNVAGRGRLRAAFSVATVGWMMNALVVAANGGMPVSASALERAGFDPATDVTDGYLYEHVAETSATRLRLLGDLIVPPIGPAREVISLGDILLAAGISLAASELSRRSHGSPEPARQLEEVI